VVDLSIPSSILSSVEYGIAAIDRDLRYVYANDAALAMVGVTLDRILGRTPEELFPPELSSPLVAHVREALARGTPVSYDVYIAASDRWYEHRLFPWIGGVTVFFSDITNRKRVEQVLRHSEASQRQLADALRESRDVLSLAMRGGRMGAWSRNLVTDAVWWSRELEEIFGVSPGGFLGTRQGYLQFAHPDDREHIQQAVQAAIDSQTDYVIEFRFQHATGEWRWMEGRGVATYSDDGAPLSLYGVGIDITARKHAEQALADARAAAAADASHLSLAMSSARLGDWRWQAATDVVTMSPRAAELFGIPPGPSMTWTEMRGLLHVDDRERARVAVDQAIATHSDYAIEYRLINGGRERWVSASGRASYAPDGTVVEMRGVVQDISHDRMLVRLDDAVRSLISADDISYTSASFLGNHLGVNRCAYAVVEDDGDSFSLTGNYTHLVGSVVGRYRFSDFGSRTRRLLHAGDPLIIEDAVTDPRIAPAAQPLLAVMAVKAMIAVPILKKQRLVAMMAVQTAAPRRWRADEVDVVKQVASRCWESLQRARIERERAGLLQAAQAANRAKDEFLAMLGHELRNPLSPIVIALQLMRIRGNSGADREREVIERQVSHLTRLVDDLLDVSRISRGKVDLQIELADLADILAQSVETAGPLLESRAHRLDLDVERGRFLVRGDRARLTQVFSNLLTNAAKYTPPGGQVGVTLSIEGDAVIVRVSDTGVGIAPELLPHVFDAFVQGPQSLDRAAGGLGLGLTIVRSLVEQHQGSVTAVSGGVGQGSEFSVRLPIAPVDADIPSPPEVEHLPIDGSGVRVLVVDDNADAADMLATALTLHRFEVRTAHDGVAALSEAATFAPHIALVDIGLPVIDGYELAGRLRKVPGLDEIELIAVTGYGQASDRERSAAAGFVDHLVKPVDIARLTERMLSGRT
jgi:PAS domain S-box-containing protein